MEVTYLYKWPSQNTYTWVIINIMTVFGLRLNKLALNLGRRQVVWVWKPNCWFTAVKILFLNFLPTISQNHSNILKVHNNDNLGALRWTLVVNRNHGYVYGCRCENCNICSMHVEDVWTVAFIVTQTNYDF